MGSIWSQTCSIGRRPPLRGHLKTQAAVVGAGMAGVLTAYALQQAGLSVVVLEAGRIAGGQTQNTTAKITSQHGLIYSRLIQSFGEETARRYAKANQDAVRAYQDRPIAGEVKEGKLDPSAIDERTIESHLYRDLPPVDFMIRTSGEERLSNFLLWQCAYAEFYFTPTLFPDFDKACFDEALTEYARRDRRMGGNTKKK